MPFVKEAAIKQTHGCVKESAGCISVQNVETPTLAATLPMLFREPNDKSEEVQCAC